MFRMRTEPQLLWSDKLRRLLRGSNARGCSRVRHPTWPIVGISGTSQINVRLASHEEEVFRPTLALHRSALTIHTTDATARPGLGAGRTYERERRKRGAQRITTVPTRATSTSTPGKTFLTWRYICNVFLGCDLPPPSRHSPHPLPNSNMDHTPASTGASAGASSAGASPVRRAGAKGKGKCGVKRELSLEDQIEELTKKARREELALEKSNKKLEDMRVELEKKKRFDQFFETMSNGTCVLCSDDLSGCIGSIGQGISSYECSCTLERIVHTKCWKHQFRCSCGELQRPHASNSMSHVAEVVHVYNGVVLTKRSLGTVSLAVTGLTSRSIAIKRSIAELENKARSTPMLPSVILSLIENAGREALQVAERTIDARDQIDNAMAVAEESKIKVERVIEHMESPDSDESDGEQPGFDD